MAPTQKSTQTLWRLCNFLNHTINVTIYVNLKKKFAKLPTLIIEIFPLKEMELKLPAQNHSRSQSFDPFGQRQGFEIDPCRWPKGSKLWEREWLKIAKICADTVGAEAIVLWTIIMNEQARCIFIHTRELICSICPNFTAPVFRWCGQMSKWWMADWPIKVRV